MKPKIKFLIIAILLVLSIFIINFEYSTSKIKNKLIMSWVEDTPGNAPENIYPLILLHGFNPIYSQRFSEFSLKSMQNSLSFDLNYVNKGLFTQDINCAQLRYKKNPIIIRATYLNKFNVGKIDQYAQNVDQIISKIKSCTGAPKVDIITHSMGGIVARYYIKNIDSNSIRKLIMLGTPNRGGLYKLGDISNFLAKDEETKFNLDFIQLSKNHQFMKSLNEESEVLEDIQYYTLAGDIDGKGDGLVLSKSVSLQGEEDHLVVSCNHVAMKYPFLCTQGYEFVKKSLLS